LPRPAPVDDRQSSSKRGYGRRWREESKEFLKLHPFCQCDDCRRLAIPLRATIVDHSIPHRGDRELFWDKSNWRAMAKVCHDRKTAKRDGGFGRRRPT
jgi:5-methylcytosine-specific restriction protein A